MHSYDNGNSSKAKKSNWAQLMKIFRKVGLGELASEQEAHWIASLEEGAAINFLCKAYEVLTQRKLSLQVKQPTANKVAGYARENSIAKVRKAMQHNDLQEGFNVDKTSKFISNVVDDHEISLQEERLYNPDRYSITKPLPVSKKLTANSEEIPVITAKEIQVRQLDRNITHLRAAKEIGGRASPSKEPPQSFSPTANEVPVASNPRSWSPKAEKEASSMLPDKPSAVLSNAQFSSVNRSGQLIPENSISLLNSCVSRVMNPQTFSGWSVRIDPLSNFLLAIDLLKNGQINLDGIVANVLKEIEASASLIADSSIVTPKQFWKVADTLCAVIINAPVKSNSYSDAIIAFRRIGSFITEKDGLTSLNLYADFALPKLVTTIYQNPTKRFGILQTLHAFTPSFSEAHVQCIKRLQNLVTDLHVFINCLAILAIQEDALDELLLDLYSYYATIGLGAPSPKLRANCLAMLSALLPEGELIVANSLKSLADGLSHNSWWEEMFQAIALSGQYLSIQFRKDKMITDKSSQNQELGEHEVATEAVRVCKKILLETINLEEISNDLALWTIQSIGPAVGYDKDINSFFFSLLHKLNDDDLQFILGLNHKNECRNINLRSSTGVPYKIQHITSTMNSLGIAKMLESMTLENAAISSLNNVQLQLLQASLATRVENCNNSSSSLSGQWLEIYQNLKSFILSGFGDSSTAVTVVEILTIYLFYSELKEAIFNDSKFMGIIKMLYCGDSDTNIDDVSACQFVFESFLRDIFKVGPPYKNGVYAMLHQFSKINAAQFAKITQLQKLLKEFAAQM